MADIFEIVGVDAQVVVGDEKFKFIDPRFDVKIDVMKELRDLEAKGEGVDAIEQWKATRLWQKKYIRMYLPDATDDFLDNKLGDSAFKALLGQITKLAQDNFGAYVKVTDDPKKAKATIVP